MTEEEIEPTIEILEFVINRISYLTIKPEFGGSWGPLCVNRGKDLCKECQQEQCNSAGGGMPDPKDYQWLVKRNLELEVLDEEMISSGAGSKTANTKKVMSKFLVEFCWKGRLIWRVGEGETRSEARMNARNREWAQFKESVLKGDE